MIKGWNCSSAYAHDAYTGAEFRVLTLNSPNAMDNYLRSAQHKILTEGDSIRYRVHMSER